MSSMDFNITFIVIEKFKFCQDSLKNSAHQFSDRFQFNIFLNVNSLDIMFYRVCEEL